MSGQEGRRESACDWEALLSRWSKEGLEGVYAGDLPPEVRASGWLGTDGATEAQIAGCEARLGTRLPPSYRSFLATSDGFHLPGGLVPQLLSAGEIEWLRVKDPETVRAWLEGEALFGPPEPVTDGEYGVYGEEQETGTLRLEYLETALQISERERAGTAVILLNPQVVTAEGEWEAWCLAHWLPGAARYRSFWELMQAEYQSFTSAEAHERRRLAPGEHAEGEAAKLSGLVEELEGKVQQWQRIEERRRATGAPLAGWYEQGIAEGLSYAAARVRDLTPRARTSGTDAHRVLRKQLEALAGELEERCQQGASNAGGLPLLALLQPGGVNTTVHAAGLVEGDREAAGVLRWFLGGR